MDIFLKKGNVLRPNVKEYAIAAAASDLYADAFDMSEAYPNGNISREITVNKDVTVRVISAYGDSTLPLVSIVKTP